MTVTQAAKELRRRIGKINALFSKVHYTQTGCSGKYAAEQSKKHLILLKGAIKILAIRSIFAFQVKDNQAERSAIRKRAEKDELRIR